MSEFHFNFLEGIEVVGAPSNPLNAPVYVLCMTSLIIEPIQIGDETALEPPACMTSSRAVGTKV